MKNIVKYALRMTFILLILCPLIFPYLTNNKKATTETKVHWILPQNLLRGHSLYTTLQQTLREQKQKNIVPQTHIFETENQHPAKIFDSLGRMIDTLDGKIIIAIPPNLWGNAFQKFRKKIASSPANQQERLFFWDRITQEPTSLKDGYLVLSEAYVPQLTFLNEETFVNVEVIGKAKPQQKIPVEFVIRADEQLINSKTETISADDDGIVSNSIQLPVTMSKAGTHVLTISLISDLAKYPFHIASTTINVTHSKTTFLHVAVGPDWSLRNLRQKLKFWPNLDLLSYYILRDTSDDMSIPNQQLSLIEFPTEKLFGSELPNFHGIVAQNFPLDMYLDKSEASNLVSYVKDGGRLLVFAGPLTFDSKGDDLSRLLPCSNTPKWETGKTYQWKTALSDTSQKIPFFETLSKIRSRSIYTDCQLHEEVSVLAQTEEGNHPMLTVMPFGKGLVLSVLSGDWHTIASQIDVSNETEKNLRILETQATEKLFTWIVEFLQRRQDSGARPPDLAGPRLYKNDQFFVTRHRGFAFPDSEITVTGFADADQSAKVQVLPFLELTGLSFTNEKLYSQTLSSGEVGDSLEKKEESRDISLTLHLENNLKSEGRKMRWPVLPGSTQNQETIPNPILYKGLKPFNEQEKTTATQIESVETNDSPLIQKYPFLLALALLIFAIEQGVSRLLWPKV